MAEQGFGLSQGEVSYLVTSKKGYAESAGRVRGRDFLEIEDRREAIRVALERDQPGDIVVIAGKGHEKSIVFGTQSLPWDDRDVAREELVRLGFTGA